MARRLSSFGKLMDLLDITISDLSKHLYMDKTTISKWRSGSRQLVKRSPYFNKILDFMLAKNEQLDGRPLHALWAQMHPDAPYEQEQLRELLVEFLEAGAALSTQNKAGADYLGSRSMPEFAVFAGVDGRKKALEHVLTAAEALPAPSVIKILELEQMDWLCRDMEFLRSMMARLNRLAENGFTIEFAFSTIRDNGPFRTFIMRLNEMRFLKAVKLYIVDTDRLSGLLPKIYAVGDVCVAVGLESMEPAVPIHTNFYSDYLNVHKYGLFFNRAIELFGNAMTITDDGARISEALHMVDAMSVKKQDLYYFGDYPSVTTMGDELFDEILEQNMITGPARERCLTYRRVMRACMTELPQEYYATFFWNIQAMEEAFTYDSLLEHELSALTNRPIRKTQEQYRRHVEEAADFIESRAQVRLVLRFGGYSRLRAYSWFKKKLWALSLNTRVAPNEHQIGFLHDTYLIRLTESICEQTIKTYPMKQSLKEDNIHTLRALAGGRVKEAAFSIF